MSSQTKLEEIAQRQKKWEQELKQNQKPSERKFITVSGEPIKELYTPLDVQDIDFNKDIGFPGEYPYTRGVRNNMYRGRLWTMRQFSGMGSARQTNQRYHFLLEKGQTGLSVAFDLPTLMGWDSDQPRSLGEVGICGVTVDSLEDMEIIFDGIKLDKISTSMTINAPASILLAMYIMVGEKQGIPSNKLTGTLQNDILKEYIAQKEWIFPPEPHMRLITDLMSFCTQHVPK
ncbi:MAG TPA: methylmalonyl-CoA mutase family protein, partial [candidate division Zixibacteria bacterium]